MFARTRRRLTSAAVIAALVVGTASCVDNRNAPPPPPVTATSVDLYGTWKGWAGSTLTLRPNGVAEVADLDGQEFRFDDGWRMTGTGSWKLSEPGSYKGGNTVGGGSVVHVKAKPSSAGSGESLDPSGTGRYGSPSASGAPPTPPIMSASPLPAAAATRTALPPAEASWDLGVVKDKAGRLTLFFLTSDPDVRDTYYLSRG
ncbi:hypothetical protein [Streptomyces sp. NPDC059176]|uniref:hypothetical protein n=1 Tax=Streptomyces sp. NPDC059176 TaxID=3346758 RepID=UPI0036A83B9C